MLEKIYGRVCLSRVWLCIALLELNLGYDGFSETSISISQSCICKGSEKLELCVEIIQ